MYLNKYLIASRNLNPKLTKISQKTFYFKTTLKKHTQPLPKYNYERPIQYQLELKHLYMSKLTRRLLYDNLRNAHKTLKIISYCYKVL